MRRHDILPGLLALALAAPAGAQEAATYRNPLPMVAGGGAVESCADPSVVGDAASGWTLYCTTDPLSGEDRDALDRLQMRLIPTFRSTDLVHWTHAGEAFDRDPATPAGPPPAWATDSALLWAPEAVVIKGRHYLLFGMTDARDGAGGEPGCASDGGIGYAVADSALGPWEAAPEPLVAPRRAGAGCDFLWTYDPEVVAAPDGRFLLLYGSYVGGLELRDLALAPDGSLLADPATARPIAAADRYEGAEVIFHDGAWWLLASASNCCNGPQTGYAVFAGRAEAPTGPFLDRNGVPLLSSRPGGTPVLVQDGGPFVGPGHLSLTRDAAGQWWALYHAVEEAEAWFGDEVGFTRRPLMLDRLDWVDGWPVVIGGPSDEARAAPALVPGPLAPPPPLPPSEEPGAPIPWASDDFDDDMLDPAWSWVREGDAALEGGALVLRVAPGDLHEGSDDAPVLLRETPEGDFVVEAKVALDLPEGCCHDHAQAGLVLYGDDDAYLKLVVVAIGATRQVEFAREVPPGPDGVPRYGSSVAAPPGETWTWLRLVVRREPKGVTVTAFVSRDGAAWDRGATWTHRLATPRVGLLAMGGPGAAAARFADLRVSRLSGLVGQPTP